MAGVSTLISHLFCKQPPTFPQLGSPPPTNSTSHISLKTTSHFPLFLRVHLPPVLLPTYFMPTSHFPPMFRTTLPLRLTSMICKLLERLIKDHMVDFLVRHKLLNSSQHGFLKARSCLTNMLRFVEEIVDRRGIASIYYLLRFSESFSQIATSKITT